MAKANSSNGSIRETKLKDGSVTYGAHVRVLGFDPVFRTFPTKAELIAWRDQLTGELRAKRKQGKVRPEMSTANMERLNAAYLDDPNTIALDDFKGIKRQLAWWTAAVGKVKVLEFDGEDVKKARAALLAGEGRMGAGRSKANAGKPRANGTVNRYIAAQRAAWNWAKADGGYGLENRSWPTQVFLKEPKARIRFLSDDELLAVTKAAIAHSPVMANALTLAMTLGARSEEMFDLRWNDIDFDQATVRYMDGKGGEPRSAYLPPIALATLAAMKARAPDDPTAHVFIDADGEWVSRDRADTKWNDIRAAAKLKNFRWHDLRHTCASFLAQHGANLLEIGTVLGHKDPHTTAKYAHMVAGKPVTGHAGMNAKLEASAKAAAAAVVPA